MDPTQVGPYQVFDKLGSGGMGTVYLGRHATTHEMAAIKVLPPALAREEGFVERFNREIESLRKLDNPHVVKLYDSGVDGEMYYYAMEYVAGDTLLSLLRRERRLPWQRAVEISIQVCRALKSAHDAGVIHRDLKPSNLLISPEGNVKLTDFGVAQLFASTRLTVTGGIIGTAEFMSPEQAQGKRATRQSDLYSLGALLYALTTGRPPFSGNTTIDIIQKHKFGQFDRPRLIVPEIPLALEELMCQLLEKEPANRPADALVVLRRLEQLLQRAARHESATLLEGFDNPDPNVSTVARQTHQPGPSGLGPATLMKNLMRGELTPDSSGLWHAIWNNTLVQITMLVLVLGVMAWGFWPRATTPEQSFERGVALLDEEPGPSWKRARREYFEPLVAADPEKWRERVAPYLERINAFELKTPSRRKSRDKSPRTEAERFMIMARSAFETGDLARAEELLRALLPVLGVAEADRHVRQAALQLMEELEAERERSQKWSSATLDQLDQWAASGRRGDAAAGYRGLIELYARDPSAAGLVTRARKALRRLEESEAAESAAADARVPSAQPGTAASDEDPPAGKTDLDANESDSAEPERRQAPEPTVQGSGVDAPPSGSVSPPADQPGA